MYGKRFEPAGHGDPLHSLASIVIFAWILGAVGLYRVGVAAYVMLAAASVMIGIALFRRRV